ncbi:DUF2065 domain-containing protein [Stenotrophomonas maltophilia]
MKDLFAAVCLVAVLEGLFLFVAPFAWKRMAERLLDLPSPALRSFGGLVLLAGLSLLWWVRHPAGGAPPPPPRPRPPPPPTTACVHMHGPALVDTNLGWRCRPAAGTTGRGLSGRRARAGRLTGR